MTSRVALSLAMFVAVGAALLWLRSRPAELPLPTVVAAPLIADELPPVALSLPATSEVPGLPPEPADPTILGNWTGRFDPPLVELARSRLNGPVEVRERIRVPLSQSKAVTVAVDKFTALGADEGVFEGIVEGKSGSTVILSYVGLAQSGIVHLPAEHRVFRIRGNDEGIVNITEVDLTNAPDCAPIMPERPMLALPRS
jgi:hypothetical protein